jgi:type IV pilus assembly protein PilA
MSSAKSLAFVFGQDDFRKRSIILAAQSLLRAWRISVPPDINSEKGTVDSSNYMKHIHTSQRGFTLIELMIVVTIIGIIAAIAVPYLNQARQATNAASAVTSLRTINSAQASYHSSTGQYGTLAQLGSANYIADQSLSSGTKSQYTFNVTTATVLNYEAVADPLIDPSNKYQHYFIDASGVMRVEVGATATVASSAVQ